ncbi:CBS domain-containing protein [Limimonas halophila]|uniref:CBS domain-containing protein n=1 Tax=Limimonas halophila TaxID=1082479 RepID=A0A1G7TQF4_9PROT|nr:CBS domain-containing protein [Limimonas halophila]SDG37525.1 CBS domain-containing protein [Limimonas halophila]
MQVKDVLKRNGKNILTVHPSSSIQTAARLLAKHRIGALVVSPDGHKPQTIISERDIVQGIGDKGHDFLRRKVGDVCLHSVRTCTPRDEVSRVMQAMRAHRVRHMPVTNKGILVGMVSIVDILREQRGKKHLG